MLGFRRFIVLFLGFGFAGAALARDGSASPPPHPQVPDLQVLLRAPLRPLLTATVDRGGLQDRLQRLSRAIGDLCRKASPADLLIDSTTKVDLAVACLWPNVVAELDETMAALATKSPDERKLFLTLAARLHPADFFERMVLPEGEIPFDALFARFLMAHRLVRDVWPAAVGVLRAQGLFEEPGDRLVEPWLTTSTPWSFALRAMRGFWCTGGDSDHEECRTKRAWAETLMKALALAEEDEQLKSLLAIPARDFAISALTPEDAAAASADAASRAADGIMHDLLTGLFDGTSANWLFFARDSVDPRAWARQVREYLSHRLEDSLTILPFVAAPAGRRCEETRRWATALPSLAGSLPCSTDADRSETAAALEARGTLMRWNFLQMRSALAFVSRANARLSKDVISRRQRERALRDVLATVAIVRTLRPPEPRVFRPDEARVAARPLALFLYDMIDGTEGP